MIRTAGDPEEALLAERQLVQRAHAQLDGEGDGAARHAQVLLQRVAEHRLHRAVVCGEPLLLLLI